MITGERRVNERAFRFEEIRVSHGRRFYRVTASPTLAEDSFPMVEVWVAETAQARRRVRDPQGYALISDRRGHWRRLRTGPTKSTVIRRARS